MTAGPHNDVLIALNYYAPYVSGLTNVARDVAVGLAEAGRRVKVVTTQHDRDLPLHEVLDGVEVERTPVLARLGKGVISPSFVRRAVAETRRSRVVNLHLPMLESALIARAAHCPVVLTYHCDIALPTGPVNDLQRVLVDASSRSSMRAARRVVVTSADYARHSRLAAHFGSSVDVIPPPCHTRPVGVPRFRDGTGFHVGFLGRIVAEKGLQHLVRGFQAMAGPADRLLIGGEFAAVAGGSVAEEIRPLLAGDDRISLLGFLPDDALPDFYASLDAFALPSINSFEAFGIVQVEAMMAGVPALASDLPGVRTPVQETGFGVVVERADDDAVARGLRSLRDRSPSSSAGAAAARALYGVDVVVQQYAACFDAAAGP